MSDRHRPKQTPLHFGRHSCKGKDNFKNTLHQGESRPRPLHHFREIFPYLCDKNGKPKEGVLEKAESSFESYSSDNVSVIGQTKIYAKNKQTQQFMTTRIFVIARERGPILLGNAACQWLGLIAVLVENKAPVVGRFVGICYQRRN